jgi:hypothetical protein
MDNNYIGNSYSKLRRSNMKKGIFILALLAAITVLPSCKKKPEQELTVTVQFSIGDSKIVSASGEKAATTGDVLSYNDRIVTGAASIVDLNYGTRGIIRITENSNVTMAALKGDTGNDQVQFDMQKGKILVVLSKLEKGSGFSVKTRTTFAAIRGTSFMVVSDPKDSRIYVLKGSILVRLAKEGKLVENIEKMLEADKKVIVSEELVNEIMAGKKGIEVVPLNQKEISEIREEIKDIKTGEKLDPEVQKELTEISHDSKVKPDATKQIRQETPTKDIQSLPSL